MSRSSAFFATFLGFAASVAIAPAVHAEERPAVIGLGAGMFFEDSERAGDEQASVQVTEEDFLYTSDGLLNAHIYFLGSFSERVRIGGGITYYGKYIAEITPEEELEEGEEPDTYEFGTLLELRSRVEYLIPAGESFDIALGGTVGLPVLFPDGDFKNEIERLQDQQASVWSLPRIGIVAGPQVSGIYQYSEHLAIRLDAGVLWERIFLFNTSEEVQDVPFRKSWTAKILKTEVALSVEVNL